MDRRLTKCVRDPIEDGNHIPELSQRFRRQPSDYHSRGLLGLVLRCPPECVQQSGGGGIRDSPDGRHRRLVANVDSPPLLVEPCTMSTPGSGSSMKTLADVYAPSIVKLCRVWPHVILLQVRCAQAKCVPTRSLNRPRALQIGQARRSSTGAQRP